MTLANRWPQVGDLAIELRRSAHTADRDKVSTPVTVKNITATLVITSDGEKYNRERLFPVAEGRYSARELRPVSDVRVLTAQGREQLAVIAQTVANLARVDYQTPEDCVTALAVAIGEAHDARARLLRLMREASRLEQESDR